jgi:hypothetical protein
MYISFLIPVDCSGRLRAKLVRLDPPGACNEETQRQPQGRIAYEKDGSWSFSYSSSGKRSAWNENQQSDLHSL